MEHDEARDEEQVPDTQDPGIRTREFRLHMLCVSVQLELEIEIAIIMENGNYLLISNSWKKEARLFLFLVY